VTGAADPDEYKIATALASPGASVPMWWHETATGAITRLEYGTAGALTTNQARITGGFLHINIGGDPTGAGHVEVSANTAAGLVDGRSHLIFQDIEARYSGNDGFSVRNAADSITFTRCAGRWNANDGLNGFSAVTNILVEDGEFTDNGRHADFLGDGLSFHVDSTGQIDDCVVARNAKNGVANSERGTWVYNRLIGYENEGGDFATYLDAGNAGSHQWNRCISRDGGTVDRGAAIYRLFAQLGNGGRCEFNNCTIVKGDDANTFSRGVFMGGTNGTILLRNSVLSGAFQIGINKSGVSVATTEDYNCVNGAVLARSGITAGANSISSAPAFVDESANNFTPSVGSPLRNAGMEITGVTDVYPGTPDIGAIERLEPLGARSRARRLGAASNLRPRQIQ
jgi:hypothetical protein